jgi:hypothetical protein
MENKKLRISTNGTRSVQRGILRPHPSRFQQENMMEELTPAFFLSFFLSFFLALLSSGNRPSTSVALAWHRHLTEVCREAPGSRYQALSATGGGRAAAV